MKSHLGNDAACGVLSIALVLLIASLRLTTGWFALDEGQIGQSAERVLAGELPHRDFDEMYTGGLTFLHAGAFRILGIRSESLRLMLLMCFAPFMLSVYRIARRVQAPPAAALITVLCGLISVPANPESMPSWYILFLTAFATVSFLRFIETRALRQVWYSGLLAGLAVLMKLTGIFLVAAGILFLVHDEQSRCTGRTSRSIAFHVFSLACLAVFGFLSLSLISETDRVMSTIHLTLPVMMLAGYCCWNELQQGRGSFIQRMRELLRLQGVFLLGVAIPLAAFAAYYASENSLEWLYEGLFILPTRRLGRASFSFPDVTQFVSSLVPAGLLFLGFSRNRMFVDTPRWMISAVVIGILASWLTENGARVTFQAARNLTPFAAAAAVTLLLRSDGSPKEMTARNQVWLLCVMTVMGSLVQFPFSINFYFLYVAPLTFLCVAFVVTHQDFGRCRTFAGLAMLLSLLTVTWLYSVVPLGSVSGLPLNLTTMSLGLPRCSLTLETSTARNYQNLVSEIQSRTKPGDFILAAPDCPEVYFLSERRNPTRVIYDFFRPEFQTDLQALDQIFEQHHIRLVILKQRDELEFSDLHPEFSEYIRRRFPNSKPIDCTDYLGSPAKPKFVAYWSE